MMDILLNNLSPADKYNQIIFHGILQLVNLEDISLERIYQTDTLMME